MIRNSFGHLLGSPKSLHKLNDTDSIIKMHCLSSCLHNQIMIICFDNAQCGQICDVKDILPYISTFLKHKHLIYTSNMHLHK